MSSNFLLGSRADSDLEHNLMEAVAGHPQPCCSPLRPPSSPRSLPQPQQPGNPKPCSPRSPRSPHLFRPHHLENFSKLRLLPCSDHNSLCGGERAVMQGLGLYLAGPRGSVYLTLPALHQRPHEDHIAQGAEIPTASQWAVCLAAWFYFTCEAGFIHQEICDLGTKVRPSDPLLPSEALRIGTVPKTLRDVKQGRSLGKPDSEKLGALDLSRKTGKSHTLFNAVCSVRISRKHGSTAPWNTSLSL